VIGLTSDAHVDLLRRYRIEAVQYGDGEQERILATTDRVECPSSTPSVAATSTSPSTSAFRQTASTPSSTIAERMRRASNLSERPTPAVPRHRAELAALAATGDLHIPIGPQRIHSLPVRDAYQALARPQGPRAHRAASPRSLLNYPGPTSAHARLLRARSAIGSSGRHKDM